MRAKAAMSQKQYAEAGREILSVPESERTAAMYVTLGESCYLAGKYDEAVRYFETAAGMKTTPEAELYAARAYAEMSQPAKAVEQLQKYLGQREKLSESELQLDPALEKIEHSKEWKTLWSKNYYSAADQKIANAAVLVKRKKYTDALNIIDVEIANRSSSAELYALRAKVYKAMEQYEPASESYRTATRLRNNNSEYFAESAELAARLKKYDAAIEDINRAVRLDPYCLELYLQRAGILRMAKRYDEARADVNFYFTYLPSDTKALYQMGMAETDAGNTSTGIEYFNMLIDKDKATHDYYMARAGAYLKAGDYKTADSDLSQALDLNPVSPEAWYQKGVALYRLDKAEDACYYWRKALDAGKKEAAEYIYKHCAK